MIGPDETEIVGNWIVLNGKAVADEVTERISELTRNYLESIATGGGWDTLFRDPSDGRFWERTHSRGEMHGGGPLKLAVLTEQEARAKYRF